MKTKVDIDQIMAEMEKVPFGNSAFQNMFFTDGQESPQRRRRHILLQLSKKIQALKACEFRRQRIDIDLEEISEDLTDMKPRGDCQLLPAQVREKRRLQIDKAEKEWQLKSEIQLINDAMVEVETYSAMLEDLPAMKDRGEFEAAELGYWEQRLLGDMTREMLEKGTVGVGVQKALGQIGHDVRKDKKSGQLVIINRRQEASNNDLLRERKADQIPAGNNKPQADAKK